MDNKPPSSDELESTLQSFKDELDKGMRFWLTFSHDKEFGGFFNCLAEAGEVYDTHKYGWFQCRQIWTYAYLYQSTEEYHTADVLDAAERGVRFIRENLPMRHLEGRSGKRCYFAVTQEGKPYRVQRKPFTECFYVMALAEMSRAAKKPAYMEEALEVLEAYIYWARVDASELGAPVLEGQPATLRLNIPMMLLCMLDIVCKDSEALLAKYKEQYKWSVGRILQHGKGSHVLEVLALDGSPISGLEGRHLNPGHAIEAGWFLLDYWQKHDSQNDELLQTAIDKYVTAPLSYGWDDEHGGILYFMDKEGFPPVHLESDMKLWWPHCEALIACLMAYKGTGLPEHWKLFRKVYDYTFSHFPDKVNGEWFGYLNRRGECSQTLKGGPYKGCFHTVRCWQMCIELLQGIISARS